MHPIFYVSIIVLAVIALIAYARSSKTPSAFGMRKDPTLVKPADVFGVGSKAFRRSVARGERNMSHPRQFA